MIQIAELLRPEPAPLWKLVQQAGVTHAVVYLPKDEGGAERPWDYLPMLRMKTRLEDSGFEVAVIESTPPLDKARLGLPGKDEEIEQFCVFIRNMGALHIPVVCYNWMGAFNWLRTSVGIPARGGALVTGYNHDYMKDAPHTEYGEVSEERMWENFAYFLQKALPVAEKAKVKLALHPDDPPISPIRGLARIMRSVEAFQRVCDMAESEYNGLTLCQGNFTLMTDDLPSIIRHFGKQGRIHFVHFRDVTGTPDNFKETFHEIGKTDMLACMKVYKELELECVLRPDHVPTLEGDQNDNPGYSSIGRLLAIGYIQGLREAVYGRPDKNTSAN
ncbi:MAG: mannonate dehydratase [Armatimonadetes bacterium]|nr:mannonate dehydratase [Armatimonadota bacterium]